MKRLFLLAFAAMMLLASCGGKEEPIEKMIPAANVEIIGDDADVISLAGDAKVFMVPSDSDKGKWKMKVLVPLKNNDEVDASSVGKLTLDVKDTNYSIISSNYGMVAEDNSIALTMVKSDEGTIKNIAFKPEYNGSEKYKKIVDFINRAENITIVFNLNYSNESSYSYSSHSSSSNSSSPSKSKSSGSANWDNLLDSYEAMVNKYIELYKKAMKGDNSAMTAYVEYMEKVEELADQIDGADDEMTSAQLNRYMKITAKMSEAVADATESMSNYNYGDNW